MKHYLTLLYNDEYCCYLINENTICSSNYKGQEARFTVNKRDADFWKGFWDYIFDIDDAWDNSEIMLTCLYAQTSFASAQKILEYPIQSGINAVCLQEITTILPALLIKKGLFENQERILAKWRDSIWSVTIDSIKPISFENGMPAYNFKESDIAEAFAMAWPVHNVNFQEKTLNTNKGSGDLALYVAESKMKPIK